MFKGLLRQLACLIAGLMVCAVAVAQSREPITIRYSERKPFQYTDQTGQPAGLLIGPTARVFAKAGIPVSWKSEPFNRSMMRIQANQGKDCSVGWYKTAERETYARFTQPIYHDSPQVGFARADFPVAEGETARALLADGRTRLLLKQSFVYGEYLDGLISKIPEDKVQRVSVEIPNLLQMLRADRADLTFISKEEAAFYATEADFPIKDFQTISLPDIPKGDFRYLICSQRVSPSVIQRLDKAIRSELKVDATDSPTS
jgi:uncharacterized protein (TIGR02285 family)